MLRVIKNDTMRGNEELMKNIKNKNRIIKEQFDKKKYSMGQLSIILRFKCITVI